jgi:hypothetical protein
MMKLKVGQGNKLNVALHRDKNLTVREDYEMWRFENRSLRTVFGPKKDGITGGWRKVNNVSS